MNDSPDPTRLYLASTSPRRAKLLRDAGYAFEQRAPGFDDSAIPTGGLAPRYAAEVLALTKAASVASDLHAGLVIGSDTVVVVDGRAMGKPRDRAHAASMLDGLFSRWHEVISGLALIDVTSDRRLVLSDTTRVRIDRPKAERLAAYLDAGDWRGKAGGYNLAELVGDWQFEIDGDPTTVIGLPMQRLGDALARLRAKSGH
jgi:septum formation protein